MSKLANKLEITKLARDLRIAPGDDDLRAIIEYCMRKVRQFIKEFSCATLDELLAAAEAKLGTRFREIHTDEELEAVKQEYLGRGEIRFACLDKDLGENVFAITLKLVNPRQWDRKYISIIDCRGGKAARAYFSKWHELAHLLTLTDQMRLSFTRTHVQGETRDPEEVLMEQIAGAVGFMPDIIVPHLTGEPSFENIDELRQQLCPGASQLSAFIGLVRAWPQPCLYLEAKVSLRKHEERIRRSQRAFEFKEVPIGNLRAVMVIPNDAARDCGLNIFQNMRVPESSVIYHVFEGRADYAEGEESLGLWRSSDGTVLPDIEVKVKAKRAWDAIRVLITLGS